MTNYSSNINSNLKNFIISFYKTSDTPPSELDNEYTNYFTNESPLIMGLIKVKNHKEIIQLRKTMWEKVSTRNHVVENVAEISPNNLLINGYVEYLLKDGNKAITDWAAHMKVIDDNNDGNYKMEFYQVYLSK